MSGKGNKKYKHVGHDRKSEKILGMREKKSASLEYSLSLSLHS